MSFRLTYATMFNPPEQLHQKFEDALAAVGRALGATHALHIDGRDVPGASTDERRSPIDRELVIGRFAQADAAQVDAAYAAAQSAFPGWRATTVARRATALRRVADVMESRVYEIAAALTIEVGKNRMEALGEAQEAVDFFRYYADDFESHDGFDVELPNDPLEKAVSRNRSVLRPYGVWSIIAPFNFPLALAAGPTAAALITGNTVVVKCASDTPWSGRMLADCIREAGLPAGVFNCLSGSGAAVGEAMIRDRRSAGVTFTGSAGVGRSIMRQMLDGPYAKPCIAEMGGKNPCIVTRDADLDRAATGIVRSAYGMGGQKCSALSRLYVDSSIADDLLARMEQAIDAIRIGDPRRREYWLGPVVNARAYDDYARYVAELRDGSARVLRGGLQHVDDGRDRGYYVDPVLAEAPLSHRLWRHEMFLPILLVHRYDDRATAMQLANDTDLGLTAGVYGSEQDVRWFHENIEAGVTYANRAQGATTGAWPGYQPFGGWKGSGSTGKAIASFYYLPLYLREQSRTVVE